MGFRSETEQEIGTPHARPPPIGRTRQGIFRSRRCGGLLRELTAHQDTWKYHTSTHRHIDWPYRLEAGRPIEPFSAQCREAMQFAYAECPGIMEATSKQGASNSSPYPLGMSCKVANVRFPLDDLSASWPRCGPPSASDKVTRSPLGDIVGARPEQRGVGRGHKRQRVV